MNDRDTKLNSYEKSLVALQLQLAEERKRAAKLVAALKIIEDLPPLREYERQCIAIEALAEYERYEEK